MKRCLVIGGLILGSSLFPLGAIAATFSQIVVYGDSLSDLGRASALTGGAAPPYSALTNGKFSNGPLWIEYLATKLGINKDPKPTNFAVGGAKTDTGNSIAPFLGGVLDQVTNTSIKDPNALYVVWAGANDYLSLQPGDPILPSVSNLAQTISTLIGRGATNILVPNLANLGELPGTRNTSFAGDLTSLTTAHNAGLALGLNSLSQQNPNVKLSLLDVNSLFNQIVADPGNFGFNNVTNGCLLVSCTTPDTYLFWDTIHPTTAGHRLIGDLAFNAVSPAAVPEPTAMLGTLVAFGSVIALKRKIKPSQLKAKELVKSA